MRKTGCMRAARCFFAPKWKGKVNPMESSNQFLDTERIGKLMQKYAIPCIISLLVGALYNIVARSHDVPSTRRCISAAV